MFLHGVVGQMHCSIIDVLGVDSILGAGRSDVALFEEIEVRVLVVEDPNANVELPIADEQRPLDVLLYDKGVMLYLECATFGGLFRRRLLFLLLCGLIVINICWTQIFFVGRLSFLAVVLFGLLFP